MRLASLVLLAALLGCPLSDALAQSVEGRPTIGDNASGTANPPIRQPDVPRERDDGYDATPEPPPPRGAEPTPSGARPPEPSSGSAITPRQPPPSPPPRADPAPRPRLPPAGGREPGRPPLDVADTDAGVLVGLVLRLPRTGGGSSAGQPTQSPRSASSPPAGPVLRSPGGAPAPIGSVAGDVRDRVVLVAVGEGVGETDIDALVLAYGLVREATFRLTALSQRVLRLRIPDNRALGDVLNALALDARVLSAQPSYVYTAAQVAAGRAAAPPQYAAARLRLVEAHTLARGRGVAVAIIDTGIDGRHAELVGALAESFDATGRGATVGEAHGTAVAGIIAARANLQGVAPGARLLGIRSFSEAPGGRVEGDSESVLKGLDYAVARGARVINMSFVGPRDPLLEGVVRQALGTRVVIVAAAGNAGPAAPPAYPAAYDGVIAVTAVDQSDRLYEQASGGAHIKLAAPGVDIVAPAPAGRFDVSSGTSLAAAHVSGVAALLLERRPDSDARIVAAWLQQAAHAVPGLEPAIVDAAGALQRLR